MKIKYSFFSHLAHHFFVILTSAFSCSSSCSEIFLNRQKVLHLLVISFIIEFSKISARFFLILAFLFYGFQFVVLLKESFFFAGSWEAGSWKFRFCIIRFSDFLIDVFGFHLPSSIFRLSRYSEKFPTKSLIFLRLRKLKRDLQFYP